MREKLLRAFLIILWVSYVPIALSLMGATWATHSDIVMVAQMFSTALAPICSKIIGIVAILRKRRGIAWQDQSPLLQAAAIFTISFVVSMLIAYVLVAIISLTGYPTKGLPMPYGSAGVLPLDWLTSIIIYVYLGLMMCALMMITIPIVLPPIILLVILICNKQISKRTFYILTFVSTLSWLVISFIGMALSGA